MIISSSGIVLSTLRYSDSSVIARIYTRSKGLRTFMVRTGKGKSALPKLGLLQPLSLVEVSFKDDERKTMHTLRSIERESALRSIAFDPLKTCIALFVAEVMGQAIGEEEANDELFKFLHGSVLLLDDANESVNFHLKFMVEFTRFLGFYPRSNGRMLPFFDMSEGEFNATEPMHPYFLKEPLTGVFQALLNVGMTAFGTVKMTNSQRRELLQRLIDYYRLHLDGMKELNSHRILEEVLS